jgi:hypothetical protein
MCVFRSVPADIPADLSSAGDAGALSTLSLDFDR